MKKLLLFAFAFGLFTGVYAQQLNISASYIGKYYWSEIITVTACDITGKDLPGTVVDNTEMTIIDQLFNVIKIVDDGRDEYAIIRILNYDPLNPKRKISEL